MNIHEVTNKDSGIAVTGDTVIVCRWTSAPDDTVPTVVGTGLISFLPASDLVIRHIKHVDDIRTELPGGVWEEENGELITDMDIYGDEYGDIAALFGFRVGEADPENYDGLPSPFSGDVWECVGTGITLLTIDFWD